MTVPPGLRRPRRDGSLQALAPLHPDTHPTDDPSTIEDLVKADKKVTPRRSWQKMSPNGTYYFWCRACDRCLRNEAAFCTRHDRAYRKQRRTRVAELDNPLIPVEKTLVRKIRSLAAALDDARHEAEAASRKDPRVAALLAATDALSRASRSLPEPLE